MVWAGVGGWCAQRAVGGAVGLRPNKEAPAGSQRLCRPMAEPSQVKGGEWSAVNDVVWNVVWW